MKKKTGILLVIGFLIASVSWKNNTTENAGYIKWSAKNKFYSANGSFASWEIKNVHYVKGDIKSCLLYTSPSPRDRG